MTLKVEEWYYWVDSMPSFVLLDGGLGHVLSERGNNIETGSLWSGRLLITCPEEVSQRGLKFTLSRERSSV